MKRSVSLTAVTVLLLSCGLAACGEQVAVVQPSDAPTVVASQPPSKGPAASPAAPDYEAPKGNNVAAALALTSYPDGYTIQDAQISDATFQAFLDGVVWSS
ncbi:hypothetical protein [Actinomyces trachealis]|uniref:hypothetical protein n=1 Tax=Actinomyces trachealis TaxID=2763540 RepID=UPI001892928F|nr:hypothetical protein [Actinomyces trachealis]